MTPDKYISSHALLAWMSDENFDAAKAGQVLGYSVSGIRGFLKKGRMPKVVGQALEAKMRAPNHTPLAQLRHHVALVPADKLEAFQSFCLAMKIATQEIPLP